MTQAVSTELRKARYGKGRIARSILQITAASAPTQLALYDELALAKSLLQDAVTVYESTTSKILEAVDSGKCSEDQLRTAFAAMALMQPKIHAGIDSVRAVAKTAADIEMSIAIQPDMLAHLAQAVERIVIDNIEDEDTKANIEHQLLTAFAETTIRSHQNKQVILSPADTVYQIDMSVPEVECDEQSYADRLKNEQKTSEPLPDWKSYDALEREE
jgi:hypothetical protein